MPTMVIQSPTDWPCQQNHYELLSGLGQGQSGLVWKARVLSGINKDKIVAIKKIDLDSCNDQKITDIRRKMLLLNQLKHPNLLNTNVGFISGKELWIVQDHMKMGSLANIMLKSCPQGIKDMNLIASLLIEILNGLEYLHDNQQVHRNIKAQNIMLQQDGSVKLADFGLACKLGKNKKCNTLVGSPCWMAPEMLESSNNSGYDSKADVWSLGITALELAYGKPPHSQKLIMKVMVDIIKEEPPCLDKSDKHWDSSFAELIEACLVKEPFKRKTIKEIKKMKFFNKVRGKEYIQEKLFSKNLNQEYEVPDDVKFKAQNELNIMRDKTNNQQVQQNSKKVQQSQSATLINWNFDIDDFEDQQQQQSTAMTSSDKLNNKGAASNSYLSSPLDNLTPYLGNSTMNYSKDEKFNVHFKRYNSQYQQSNQKENIFERKHSINLEPISIVRKDRSLSVKISPIYLKNRIDLQNNTPILTDLYNINIQQQLTIDEDETILYQTD